MAVQILPIVKTLAQVAPYIADVAKITIPAFTSRKDSGKTEGVNSDQIVAKQIEELQAAASQNAQSVKLLAEKLQQAIQDIERTAEEQSNRLGTYNTIIYSSLGLSCLSLAICAYLLIR